MLPGVAVHFVQRCQEAHGPVADGQFVRIHATRFQSQQYFPPTLRRFSHAVFNRLKKLTMRINVNNRQHAQFGMFYQQAAVNAVGSEIDPLVAIQTIRRPPLCIVRRSFLF